MFDLNGQIAVVTGGASGIGKGIVTSLSKAGAKVMILDLDEEKGNEVANEVNGQFFKTDITNEQQVKKVIATIVNEHGKIDILAANAGMYPQVMIEDMTEEDWDRVFDLNLKGMFYTVKPVLKVMKENGYGRVILYIFRNWRYNWLSWRCGIWGDKSWCAWIYAKCRDGICKYGVTVNAVQPGVIATEGLKRQLGELSETAAEYIPMKKLGDPEDIGAAVVFLGSKEAKYITGQSIVVDGGQVLPESPGDVL